MISDEVNNSLLAVRSGRTQLQMEGHILLLNWNNLVGAGLHVEPPLLSPAAPSGASAAGNSRQLLQLSPTYIFLLYVSMQLCDALESQVCQMPILLQVPFILKQLESFQGAGGMVGGYQQQHPFAGRPLVILADKDKEQMDDLVGVCCAWWDSQLAGLPLYWKSRHCTGSNSITTRSCT